MTVNCARKSEALSDTMLLNKSCARRGRGAVAFAVFCSLTCTSCTEVSNPGVLTTTVADTKEPVNATSASMLRIADATSKNGDAATAAVIYEKILKENPDMKRVRTSLGETHLESGNPDLALRYFNEAHKKDPTDTDSLVGAGQSYMAKNQAMKAKSKFEAAVKNEPENPAALTGLGVALDALGRHADAQKRYLLVLKKDPQNKAARNNFGLSLALSGQYDQALKELFPLSKEEGVLGRRARQNISMSFAMKGDFTSAVKWAQADLSQDQIRENLRIYGSIARE